MALGMAYTDLFLTFSQSVFGYISVLPGAFSAYRYRALLNGPDGHGPLASYFKGEAMHGGGSDASIFERNMYLAEDRILCFEIVTKKREGWVLKYVKSAKASTDVPTTVCIASSFYTCYELNCLFNGRSLNSSLNVVDG
jgi:cellulose synthase/poly-beta-1,6-N-acetylglucosamine synthase-like glycosyltransferase